MSQWELSRKERVKAEDCTSNHRFSVTAKEVIHKFISSANLSWEPSMHRRPSSSKHRMLVIVWGGVFLSPGTLWIHVDKLSSQSHHYSFWFMRCGVSLGIRFPPWFDAYMCLVIIVSSSHLYLNHTCTQALNPRLTLLMHKEGTGLEVWWAVWVLRQGKEHGCREMKCNWLTWKSTVTLKKLF